MQDNMTKVTLMSAVNHSLHRQTAIYVEFTDGELKLLYPTVPSSNLFAKTVILTSHSKGLVTSIGLQLT